MNCVCVLTSSFDRLNGLCLLEYSVSLQSIDYLVRSDFGAILICTLPEGSSLLLIFITLALRIWPPVLRIKLLRKFTWTEAWPARGYIALTYGIWKENYEKSSSQSIVFIEYLSISLMSALVYVTQV